MGEFIGSPGEHEDGGGGAVSSVFGRIGAITADPADYASLYQPIDSDLTALAALAGTGLIVRTGAGAVAARTLTGPAAGLSVANGDGVSGDPTLSLANDLAALEALASTGIARRTGSDTWSVGTLVSYAELTNATGQYHLLARTSSGSGAWEDVTGTAAGFAMFQAASATAQTALLDLATTSLKGLVQPAQGGEMKLAASRVVQSSDVRLLMAFLFAL